LTVSTFPYAQGEWRSVNSTTEVTLGGDIRQVPEAIGESGGDPHVKPIKGDAVLLSNQWKTVLLYNNEASRYRVVASTRLLKSHEQASLHRLDSSGHIISINPKVHKYVSNLTYFSQLDVYLSNVHLGTLDLLKGEFHIHDDSVRSIQELHFVQGLMSLTHRKRYTSSDLLKGFRVHMGENSIVAGSFLG